MRTDRRSPPPIAWGSRHLYPVVPLLLLPAFLVREHAPLARWWAVALVVVSIPWQAHGVWQKAQLGPPIWWLIFPQHRLAAAVLFVLLLLALWRLVVALDLRRVEAEPARPD